MGNPTVFRQLTTCAVLFCCHANGTQGQPARNAPSAPRTFLEAKTWFQTNVPYDPRLAIATDAVVVHRHGASLDDMRQAIGSWKQHGYLVGRMFFSDSDGTNAYWKGKWDGRPHEDEVERGPDGKPVMCGDVRPYMLPTEGWARYCEEQVMIGIQAGADAILPEEPLAHSFSGYEAAFKPMFEKRFGVPWQPENASPEAHFLNCQLKAELYHDLEERLARLTKQQARQAGRDITFALPVHALYSNLASQLVAPMAGANDIRELDGYVGQVWTGPVNWCTANYSSADKSFFASAYALYDYFAGMTAGTNRKMWLLADPVEDDPNHKWSEFQEWYVHCLVAKLMFPSVDTYEVMPWPDRVFLPGHTTGGGTPAPENYRISLLSALQVLQEVPATARPVAIKNGSSTGAAHDRGNVSAQDRGNLLPQSATIGVAVADSALWEPVKFPMLDGLYSLVLPLIHQGVPVTASLAERWTEPRYLDRFGVIVLSYENFKPLRPDMHTALVKWVEKGGVLVVLGAAGDMKGQHFWWNKLHHSSPLAHLYSVLKISPESQSDAQVGRGWVIRRQTSPKHFADAAAAKKEYIPLIEHALGRKKPTSTLARQGGFCIQRGPFVIAHALSEPVTLDGRYINVLDPEVPLVNQIKIDPGHSAVYRDVSEVLAKRKPTVLHCTHRLMEQSGNDRSHRVLVRGPAETPGVVRFFTAGRSVGEVRVTAADGRPVKAEVTSDNETARLRFPNVPEGALIEIQWGKQR